eukprot:scaffold34608_cov172-Amphora_coffeaeformis.AAC.6
MCRNEEKRQMTRHENIAVHPRSLGLSSVVVVTVLLLFATCTPVCSFCLLNTNPRTHQPRFLASEEATTLTEIQIRDSLYGELKDAVDVILESFYADAKPPWNHMYRLAELNRLQQGFPYADREMHRMLVAVAKDEGRGRERIVGFCDCDLRKPNQNTSYRFNPRPYISDLCVSPSIRRQGVANRLVEYCEEFCKNSGKDEAYIRVERENVAAVTLYTNLGYLEYENHLDDSEKIVILRKSLKS